MDAFGTVNMHANEPYRQICFHPSLETSFDFRLSNGDFVVVVGRGERRPGVCTFQVSTRTMLKQRANSKETSQGKSDDVTDDWQYGFWGGSKNRVLSLSLNLRQNLCKAWICQQHND